MKNFSPQKLINARKQLNLSQKELSIITKLPQSHISRIENGTITPNHNTILKIAAALNIKPSELFASTDDAISNELFLILKQLPSKKKEILLTVAQSLLTSQ